MKKLFVFLALLLPIIVAAQSVTINNDGSLPDNSAILDIKSSSKGLLMPRLTTAERTSIAGPAIGLTVFDTDTFSFWMYRGDVNGGWAELQHNFQNMWSSVSSNIYNKNSGNVGIGTMTPQEKLSINAANPGIQLLNNGTARAFLQLNSTDIKLGTYNTNATGSILFTTKGLDRMTVNENGQVGIGTTIPVSELTINGSNPYLQMQNSGVNKGFLQLISNDVKLGTNSTNTTGNLVFQTKLLDRMMVDENGQVGIGTNSPSSILTINAANPILQLRNSNVDKGFLQIVDDNIKIGTNLSNTTGHFIVRTNGADRFYVDENGNAGLGTNTEGGNLSLNGIYTSLALKTGGVNRLNIAAVGANPEIVGSGSGVLRIRNNNDGIYMYSNGRISIGGGGAIATGYTISVEGKLIATEVTSLPFGSWPDYVFANDYKLRPLVEVKKFIEKNKHLPNIPSAAQIEKEGIQLGDMSKRLMEKVEELTLYILQQQEQIDELKKLVQSQKKND